VESISEEKEWCNDQVHTRLSLWSKERHHFGQGDVDNNFQTRKHQKASALENTLAKPDNQNCSGQKKHSLKALGSMKQ